MDEKKYLGQEGLARLVAHIKIGYADKESVETLERKLERIPEYDLDDIVGSVGKAEYAFEPRPDDIPKVFIDGTIPTTKDEVLAELTYISNTNKFHAYIVIKCQGTSSMKYPKKNFTIKMYTDEAREIKYKKNFKTWGPQSKFCLKANWIDLSHARNVVSAQLGGDILETRLNYEELPDEIKDSPNHCMVDGFPIKVYANGIYQGRYTWNIPKDAWMANMDDDLDNHCILCGENYDGGCFRALPVIDGSDWSDEIHDTCPQSIKTRWTEVVNFIMTSSDADFKNYIDNYIDLESLIDYHVFGIYCCGLDAYGKNQLYITYDGIKWYASLYDMDSTWGLYWNGETMVAYDYAREKFEDMVNGRLGNLLFERLEANFGKDLRERWEALKKSALSMSNIINRFERFTDHVPQELIKEDYASTTAGGGYSSIPSIAKNNIQQIRNFAAARRVWTDDYFDKLAPIEQIPCKGLILSDASITFTSSGTHTIVAYIEPANTTDKLMWASSNEKVVTVDRHGVVTTVGNGSAIITATCGTHSATCMVSVSGVVSPDAPSDNTVLYSLPAPVTFTGTNYIDTGISPLATDNPFTIFIDWTHTGESDFANVKHVILHCATELSPYPGIILQYATSGITAEFRQNTNVAYNSQGAGIANADLFNAKIIYRKDANGKITIARCFNNNGLVQKDTKDMSFVAVPENVRLGCYQTTLGGTGRFARGIMNDCVIYNYALTDEQIEAILLS